MILNTLKDEMLPYLEWKTENMGTQEIEYLNFLLNKGSKKFCKKYSESILDDLFENYIKINEYLIDNFTMYIGWTGVLKELSEYKDYNTLSIILNKYKNEIYNDLYKNNYLYIKNKIDIDIQFISKFDYFHDLIVDLSLNYIYRYHLYDSNKYLDFDKNEIKINGYTVCGDPINLEKAFIPRIGYNSLSIFEQYKNYTVIEKYIYYIGRYNDKSDILKYNHLLDWKILTRKMITDDISAADFVYILNKYYKYLDWDYVSCVFNIKSIGIINKYIKYINKDLFNANNETYIIDEDNKVKNITSRYNKLLSKRIQIGIPRKDAIKLKNSKYFKYRDKTFDITDEKLLYTICKKLDKNYYFYQTKMSKERLKILEVLDKYYNYTIDDIDITSNKSTNIIKPYNHFISANEKDVICDILKRNHIVKKDDVLNTIEKVHELYKPLIGIFVSLPKIEKRKTEDAKSSKWNIVKVEMSVKTFADINDIIKKINTLKPELLKFILYYISDKDKEISVMIDYLKPYNCIITTDKILHIEFIIDERLEKIL